MKRRHFIKTAALSYLGLSVLPQLSFQTMRNQLPYEELIGKGKPQLFGDGFALRKEAYDAFLKLSSKAFESDIHVQVVSSYRGFAHQNQIWERKYKRYTAMGLSPTDTINTIIKYSTIPGTSRHHWATEIDLIDANVTRPRNILNPNHFGGSGCFSRFKTWMDANANDFGFYLVYSNKKDRKGFNYEPWHYSYRPLSKVFLDQYKRLNLKDIITSETLLGNEHFSDDFIETYREENILDINPELL